jgi:hypothetical protein
VDFIGIVKQRDNVNPVLAPLVADGSVVVVPFTDKRLQFALRLKGVEGSG